MTSTLRQLSALLLSTAILITGNGLINTLLPVRAEIESFTTLEIGVLGAIYFVGFTLGCIYVPLIVRRVGHIRTFATLSSIAAATALIHAILVDPVAWWVLRFAVGVSFAGLYIVIESWLNDRTASSNRGAVMSAYTFINLCVLMLGQFMLTLYPPDGFEPFAIVAVLLGLALVPVSLTTAPSPRQPDSVRLDIGALWRLSPVALVACLAVGLANGSFWTMGPVFASRSGLDIDHLVYFMAAATLAAAVAQWPLGRLSDYTDRRFVIVAVAVGAAVSGALLSGWPQPSRLGLVVLAAAFGAFAMPLYALAVAHANDFAADDSFVTTAGGQLLVFGIGAAIGPLIASTVMAFAGPGGLFLFTTAVHAALVVFAFARIRVRAAPAEEERSDFVAVPRTSPAFYELDPRSEPDADSGDGSMPHSATSGRSFL